MAYALYTDVAARVGRTLSASSAPTQAQVTTWISQAEAELDGALDAQGITNPVTDASGILFLTPYVCARAAMFWLQNKDSVTDEATATAQIEAFRDEWRYLTDKIERNPDIVAAMVGHPFNEAAGSGRIRGYATDNDDDLSISAGDFDPVFTRKMER